MQCLRALPARQARPRPQPIEGGSTPHALRDGAQARLRSVSGGQRGAPSEHGRRAPTSRREIHISRGDHISRRDIGASNPTMRLARARVHARARAWALARALPCVGERAVDGSVRARRRTLLRAHRHPPPLPLELVPLRRHLERRTAEHANELAVIVGVREVLVVLLVGVPQHGAHLGERGVGGDGHDLARNLPPVVALRAAATRHAQLPREEAAVPQRLAS